jgi:hypothetical protein
MQEIHRKIQIGPRGNAWPIGSPLARKIIPRIWRRLASKICLQLIPSCRRRVPKPEGRDEHRAVWAIQARSRRPGESTPHFAQRAYAGSYIPHWPSLLALLHRRNRHHSCSIPWAASGQVPPVDGTMRTPFPLPPHNPRPGKSIPAITNPKPCPTTRIVESPRRKSDVAIDAASRFAQPGPRRTPHATFSLFLPRAHCAPALQVASVPRCPDSGVPRVQSRSTS